eukprot:3252526-Pleurochrysis_carterae.AAC.1
MEALGYVAATGKGRRGGGRLASVHRRRCAPAWGKRGRTHRPQTGVPGAGGGWHTPGHHGRERHRWSGGLRLLFSRAERPARGLAGVAP